MEDQKEEFSFEKAIDKLDKEFAKGNMRQEEYDRQYEAAIVNSFKNKKSLLGNIFFEQFSQTGNDKTVIV